MQITNSWKRRLIGLWLAHITFLNLTSQLPLDEKSTTLKEYLFSRRYNGKTEISNILNLVVFFASQLGLLRKSYLLLYLNYIY